MARYTITGTLSPDATVADTGEAAGQYDGQDYWTWTNDAGTWYLAKWAGSMMNPASVTWGIGPRLGISVGAEPGWQADGPSDTGPAGTYSPTESATGTATVAEVIASDDEPDGFAFTGISDAEPSTVYTSESKTITGMDAETAISITGGEYRINGGDWTSDTGEIDPDDTLELRTTSVATYGPKTVVVTVGSVSVSWTVSVPVKINFGLSLTGTVQVNFTR